MSTIPPLRDDLRIREDRSRPDVPYVVLDRGLSRRIRLDSMGAEVARLLDRPQSPEELATRLGITVDQLDRPLAFFQAYHLLDTDESRRMVKEAEATRAYSEMDAQTVPLLIRDDARFTCTMCGSCCGGTNIGPVSDEVLEGLKPHLGTLEKKTRATSGLFFTVPGGQEGRHYTLCRQKGGSCVFLGADNRCVIHADYGGDAKPDDCRLFPWMFTATPDGIAVSVQMECRGFPEARHGKKLSEQEDEIRALLSLAQTRNALPAILTVTGHLTMTYADYRELETKLHEAVDRLKGEPSNALVCMRDVIFEATGLESDTSVSRTESLKNLLGNVISRCVRQVRDIRANLVSTEPELELHTESLDLVCLGLETLLTDLERVVEALDQPDAQDLFADKMHHFLMQKELLSSRSLLDGFVDLVFQWFLSKALAFGRVREVKRRHISGQDLMDAFTVTSLVWRTPEWQALLEEVAEEMTLLFVDQLHQLTAEPHVFSQQDVKTHIYKF